MSQSFLPASADRKRKCTDCSGGVALDVPGDGALFFLVGGESTGRFLLTFLLVPLTCFFVLLMFVQMALWLTMIPTRLLKLGRQQCERLAGVFLLSFFGAGSLVLLGDLEPTAHFLGWLWWAGLAFCLLIHAVGKSTAEGPDARLQLKPENWGPAMS